MIVISEITKRLLLSPVVEDIYIGFMKYRELEPTEGEIISLIKSKYREKQLVGAYLAGKRGKESFIKLLSKIGTKTYHGDREVAYLWRKGPTGEKHYNHIVYLVYPDHTIHIGFCLCDVEYRYNQNVKYLEL